MSKARAYKTRAEAAAPPPAPAEAPPTAPDRITNAVRPSRDVLVHLTPFAPGLAQASTDSAKRNRVLWGRSPDQVVRVLCERLRVAPGEVQARPGFDGEPEIARHTATDEPLALIWGGLSIEEINASLSAHIAAGWSPPSLGA
jgi:hypothetical protein